MFWRKAPHILVISILLVGGISAPSTARESKLLAKISMVKSLATTCSACASVLPNDSVTNGDTLSVQSIDTSGTTGQVTDKRYGTFNYDPDGQFEDLQAGQQTTDSFDYTISDGYVGADSAMVPITINGINDPPTAEDDSGTGYITDEDTPFTTANVLANDDDPEDDALSIQSIDTSNTAGHVTDKGDGTFDYDPDGQYEDLQVGQQATDTFTYTISDGHGGTDSATVTITVNGVNDAPTAADDSGPDFTTGKDTPFTTTSVLTNDSDPEDDTLTVQSIDTSGTTGQVTNNGDGTFDYDPDGQYDHLGHGQQATDSFEYTVSDGNGGTDSATVTITIYGVNILPTAQDDMGAGFTSDEDTPFTTSNVLTNDEDLDGDTLTVLSIDTSGTKGQVTDKGDGTFDYDPDGQFEDLQASQQAADTFTYTITDGYGGTDTAKVMITITGVDDGFWIYLPLVMH